MSSAAENTSASQSSASQTVVVSQRPTKTPHDHPRSSLEQPRQRRRLDPEDDETVVATPAATGSGSGSSSQARAELFKDNRHGGDDMGSEYTASSSTEEDDEDNNTPVPSKRSRGSARLRMKAVRDSSPPSRSRSLGPVSEGSVAFRGKKPSLARSVMVCVPKRVTPSKRRISNVPASQKLTNKPAYRSPSAGGPRDLIKRLREYKPRISAGSPDQRATGSQPASGQPTTIPASAGRVLLTPPKPQVTGAGSVKSPEDDGSAAVMQFLAGIGLGQSHFQILIQEGIRTQQDLDGLRQMEKDSIAELGDVLRARGFTAFEFSKVEYAISKKKN